MVKKIKKKKRLKRQSMQGAPWTVPFNKDGRAGVYIHKHGDTNDHSECGPVVLCCEQAADTYRKIAPELHADVTTYQPQSASHLSSWFETGVQAMYFVLCDPSTPEAVYQFGLPKDEARSLLMGHTPRSNYRLDQCRVTTASEPPV